MHEKIEGPPDQWRVADEQLREIVTVMATEADSLVHYIAGWDDQNSVDSPLLAGCEVYSALQTDEHTDDGFPQWTVLLVLRASGHTVKTNNGAVTMTPEVGDLLLFDLYQMHVLDLPQAAFPADERECWTPEHIDACCRDYPFVAAHLDLETRPTREEAERMFVELLRPAMNHKKETVSQPSPR